MTTAPADIMPRSTRRATLADTPFVASDGRAAEPLPFELLVEPLAALLRTGADRARCRIETMLVHRALAIREGPSCSHPAFHVRTPCGEMRIQVHASSMKATTRLDMGEAYILGRELVLPATALPGTMCAALAGEPVERIAQIPILPADTTIRQARALGRTTRMILDLDPVDLLLEEIPRSP